MCDYYYCYSFPVTLSDFIINTAAKALEPDNLHALAGLSGAAPFRQLLCYLHHLLLLLSLTLSLSLSLSLTLTLLPLHYLAETLTLALLIHVLQRLAALAEPLLFLLLLVSDAP